MWENWWYSDDLISNSLLFDFQKYSDALTVKLITSRNRKLSHSRQCMLEKIVLHFVSQSFKRAVSYALQSSVCDHAIRALTVFSSFESFPSRSGYFTSEMPKKRKKNSFPLEVYHSACIPVFALHFGEFNILRNAAVALTDQLQSALGCNWYYC